MRSRVSFRALTILALLLSFTFLGNDSFAQTPAGAAEPAAGEVSLSADAVLQRGAQLDRDRKWAESVTLYEEALKRFPENAALKHRFALSRMHFDLGRRYDDASFREMLEKLTNENAQRLFSAVTLKLHTYYVESPQWKSLLDKGTLQLEVALTDEVFLKRHLRAVDARRIDEFRRDLRTRLAGRSIRSRHDVKDAVNYAAWLASQRLGLSHNAVILEYTCGIADSLDDYSSFLSSGELTDVYAQIEGNFVGLGVELKPDDGGLLILRVITGSPAEKAGIRTGDRIVAVDGRATRDMSSDQAADLLQGVEGSTVQVSVVTNDMPIRVIKIRRAHIDVPSVTDTKMLDTDSGIAYLRLNSFQKTTSNDMDTALWRLHRMGMKSLIMDLRGNPGGLLTASVKAADKFIDSGIIVSTRGRNAGEDYTYRAHSAGTWRVPLIVLIDGDSASASEIFAGAIRDHRRGAMVGTRSYGKGTVQGIFSLNVAESGIRLTTAKFFSPNGHPFSKVGVKPDVEVRQVAKIGESQSPLAPVAADKDDPVVAAAIQLARERMARRNTTGSR